MKLHDIEEHGGELEQLGGVRKCLLSGSSYKHPGHLMRHMKDLATSALPTALAIESEDESAAPLNRSSTVASTRVCNMSDASGTGDKGEFLH
jgi:hypothetical protein